MGYGRNAENGNGRRAGSVESLRVVLARHVHNHDGAASYIGERGKGGIEACGGGASRAHDSPERQAGVVNGA
jgi:hypothetical protein